MDRLTDDDWRRIVSPAETYRHDTPPLRGVIRRQAVDRKDGMSYTATESENLAVINKALVAAADDFGEFFKLVFAADVDWTIAGHGPVARAYSGLEDVYTNAEEALFNRLAEPLKIKVVGIWADDNQVFARIQSASRAIDGAPYSNEYMYILTLRDGQVVSGIEWLDLHAYYEIIRRVPLPE